MNYGELLDRLADHHLNETVPLTIADPECSLALKGFLSMFEQGLASASGVMVGKSLDYFEKDLIRKIASKLSWQSADVRETKLAAMHSERTNAVREELRRHKNPESLGAAPS